MALAHSPSIVTSGLSLCIDAANPRSYSGSGTLWKDVSGNGNTATWYATPSFTSAGPLSYFSTLGNRCQSSASNSFGINNSSGYTIFLMMMQNSLAYSSAFKFYGTGVNGRGIFSHCTWIDNNVYFDQGGCCGADTRTAIASGGSQTWNIWTLKRETNGSIRTIWKNGTVLTTNTATAADINLTSTALDIGGSDEYGGNSSTWDARLNAFLVYNRGLSDSEIAQVVGAYSSRYSV
jgi:hypothetical protein